MKHMTWGLGLEKWVEFFLVEKSEEGILVKKKKISMSNTPN